jgi:hypothetical protein
LIAPPYNGIAPQSRYSVACAQITSWISQNVLALSGGGFSLTGDLALYCSVQVFANDSGATGPCPDTDGCSPFVTSQAYLTVTDDCGSDNVGQCRLTASTLSTVMLPDNLLADLQCSVMTATIDPTEWTLPIGCVAGLMSGLQCQYVADALNEYIERRLSAPANTAQLWQMNLSHCGAVNVSSAPTCSSWCIKEHGPGVSDSVFSVRNTSWSGAAYMSCLCSNTFPSRTSNDFCIDSVASGSSTTLHPQVFAFDSSSITKGDLPLPEYLADCLYAYFVYLAGDLVVFESYAVARNYTQVGNRTQCPTGVGSLVSNRAVFVTPATAIGWGHPQVQLWATVHFDSNFTTFDITFDNMLNNTLFYNVPPPINVAQPAQKYGVLVGLWVVVMGISVTMFLYLRGLASDIHVSTLPQSKAVPNRFMRTAESQGLVFSVSADVRPAYRPVLNSPGPDGELVGRLWAGDAVVAYSRQGDWLRISMNGTPERWTLLHENADGNNNNNNNNFNYLHDVGDTEVEGRHRLRELLNAELAWRPRVYSSQLPSLLALCVLMVTTAASVISGIWLLAIKTNASTALFAFCVCGSTALLCMLRLAFKATVAVVVPPRRLDALIEQLFMCSDGDPGFWLRNLPTVVRELCEGWRNGPQRARLALLALEIQQVCRPAGLDGLVVKWLPTHGNTAERWLFSLCSAFDACIDVKSLYPQQWADAKCTLGRYHVDTWRAELTALSERARMGTVCVFLSVCQCWHEREHCPLLNPHIS